MKLFILLILNVSLLYKIQFWVYLSGAVQLWDFDTYYQTVKDTLAGQNPYTLPYMQISGPPVVLLPYIPFTWFSLEIGRALMSILSLVAGFATSWLVASKLRAPTSWKKVLELALLFNALLLISFPARFNFITGQPNLIIMWLFAVMCFSGSEKHKGLASGVAAVIKTNYLLVIVACLKYRKKSFIWSTVILIGSLLVSLLLFNPEGIRDYVTHRGPSFAFSTVQPFVDVDYYNQSIRATMGRFQIGDWYPIVYVTALVIGTAYLLKTGDLISGIILSLILSPIVWQHYIVIVYPILILTGYSLWKQKKVDTLFVVASALLLVHIPAVHYKPPLFPYNVVASHFFIGLVALLVHRIWHMPLEERIK